MLRELNIEHLEISFPGLSVIYNCRVKKKFHRLAKLSNILVRDENFNKITKHSALWHEGLLKCSFILFPRKCGTPQNEKEPTHLTVCISVTVLIEKISDPIVETNNAGQQHDMFI